MFTTRPILREHCADSSPSPADPTTHAGYELVAAGMLIMAAGHEAKPLDHKALARWTPVDYERGMRSREGER
jgi:hypothetical protein